MYKAVYTHKSYQKKQQWSQRQAVKPTANPNKQLIPRSIRKAKLKLTKDGVTGASNMFHETRPKFCLSQPRTTRHVRT